MGERRRKWALIASATAGGIGEAYAITFRRRGVNVIAAAADTNGMEYLEPEKGSDDGFLITLELDATSASSIAAAVQQIRQLTDGTLDFLINCCDSAYYVPLMDADIEQAKSQYEVCVWGLLAVTQAVFPLLRDVRGMVVNHSSVAGLQGSNRPFAGIDASANAAILHLSSTMRVELEPFGIRVVALVSGAVQTEVLDHVTGGGVPEQSAYFPIKDEIEQVMSAYSANKGRDRYQVATETIDQLLSETPPLVIRKGYMASLSALLYWLVPTWILDSWAIKQGRLDRLKLLLSGSVEEKKDE
ncbi:Hypothetical predicted protein [Lecanosticta acicola]|uniref:Uncharacterized protein n=1 Tax=Lecanosticta acicola TaxID=111012 RepID=A0AAI9E9Q1_9PEZI|nr:Hypothetical predicted protein [Lecanosticta acicola]